MKISKIKNLAAGISFLAASLLSNGAASNDDGAFFGNKAAGKWIIGAKAVNIDPNYSNIDDAKGLGIVLGYQFDKTILGGRGKSSFELEYIQGDEQEYTYNNIQASYEADILNAFFTYRSPGTIFYKLKGGLSYSDIDENIGGLLFDDFESTSFALGGGLGVRVGDYGIIELDYTQDTGDANLGLLSLNGLLQF